MGNNDKDGIIQLPVPPVPVPPDRPFVMPPKTVDVGHDCRAFEPCADCADENAVVNAPPCVGCYHGGVYDINRDGFPCLWRTVEPGRAQDETPEPPTLSSMRGIAPGMTGGMDSVEFVRRGRDGATIICDAVKTPGDLDSLAARVRELEAAIGLRADALKQPPDAEPHPVYGSVAEHVSGIAALLLLDGSPRGAELVAGVVPRVLELEAALEQERRRFSCPVHDVAEFYGEEASDGE